MIAGIIALVRTYTHLYMPNAHCPPRGRYATSAPLYLLDEFDTSRQIHAEVDEGPLDTLALVLLLLEHEHVMVEELLQLLVGEVDAELLEPVELVFCFILFCATRECQAKRDTIFRDEVF